MKRLLSVLLVIALALSLAACAKPAAGGAPAAGEEIVFKIAIGSGYDSLNFFATEQNMVYDFLNICYDSLIAYDAEYNAIPRAATSWEVSDDGMVWTFHLRDDIVFNDGEKLTSADVKWTYEHAVDSYMYSTHASGFSSIECPDDYTVVFNCESAKPDMLYQIIPILPEHIWSALEDVFTYESETLVGSGPFIYSAERSGAGNVAFVKNDQYWGEKPNIDVLVFSQYDNADAMAQALQIGEVDACYQLEKAQHDTLVSNSDIYVGEFESFGFEYLGYNQLDPLLSDKTIRQAIDHCFDRDVAIEMGYSGLALPAYGAVNNVGFVWEPGADVKRAFDTAKAAEMLEAAGYTDTDGDGIREKDGAPLSFELITGAERSSWQSAVVNMLIANCKAAGVEIKWNALELVTMWDTCADGNASWQMTLDGWGGDADPGFIMCIFQDYESLGYAGISYQNPAFDELYQKAYATVDPAERKDLLDQCQALLYEDCPYTFICFDETVQAINQKNWQGFVANSNGLFGNELLETYMKVKPAA